MRYLCVVGLVLPSLALGQIPDVQIKLDVRANYTNTLDRTGFQYYDSRGRTSTVGLQLQLEPGLRMTISERLQKILNDGDPDLLQEAYVEDVGNWRIGKQFLPFGNGIIRDNANAIRLDSNFIQGFPTKIAVFDSGVGRPRGISGRIGRGFGVSFAAGDHFSTNASTLTLVRRPEDSPGRGGGYHNLYGFDGKWNTDQFAMQAEFVALKNGVRNDSDEEIFDLSATVMPRKYQSISVGFTRAFETSTNFLRFEGSFYVYNGVSLEPLIRYRDGKFYDLSVSLRLKF